MAILIVDDAVVHQRLMETILHHAGHTETLTAGSAHEAFELLGMNGTADQVQAIDLILLDVLMPEIDGVEACRRIKAVERLRTIPIIMTTAVDEIEPLVSAFAMGAIDYITKPLKKPELLARVNSALRLRANEQALVEQNLELARALQEIKTLRGLIPICAWCKNIRDDKGYWRTVEEYITDHSEVAFSHSICNECVKTFKESAAQRVANND
jgi:sigma-B regulation protein RsbU (phosphoserine phosphatase)